MAARGERVLDSVYPPTGLSPVYTFVSKAAAMCVSFAAMYGYMSTPAAERSVFLIPTGLGFTGLFTLAVRRKAGQQEPKYQVLVVIAMICASLALHLLYLPAGLCCFVCLMVCQNELIYKPKFKAFKKSSGKQS